MMGEIRQAKHSDLAQLVEIAMSHAKVLYPGIIAERDKITALAKEALSSKQYFAQVVEREGRVDSVLIAGSGPHGWGRKSVSQIMLWVSGCRGDGRQLLRAYMAWLESRPVIRSAGLYLDFDAPQWLSTFMQSEGFTLTGGALQWYRG